MTHFLHTHTHTLADWQAHIHTYVFLCSSVCICTLSASCGHCPPLAHPAAHKLITGIRWHTFYHTTARFLIRFVFIKLFFFFFAYAHSAALVGVIFAIYLSIKSGFFLFFIFNSTLIQIFSLRFNGKRQRRKIFSQVACQSYKTTKVHTYVCTYTFITHKKKAYKRATTTTTN